VQLEFPKECESEGRGNEDIIKIFEEIMVTNFPNLMKT
jgi:hypothetical protein